MQSIGAVLNDFGLSASSLVADGVIHRCYSNAKRKRNKDGWFCIIEHDGKYFCYYGCWLRNEKGRCCSGDDGVSTERDDEAWKVLSDLQAQANIDREKEAREIAGPFVEKLALSDGSHPYLKRKSVGAYGIYQSGEDLIIPVTAPSDGMVSSYQIIGSTGIKKFLYKGVVSGGCFPIQGNDSVVCICEGYATGATIYQATGFKVLVAFNAGNLGKVAQMAVNTFQKSNILICADNDHTKEGSQSGNVGLTTGRKVAEGLGIDCVWPTGIEGSDFNDMAAEGELSDVSDIIIRGRVVEIYKTGKKERRFDFLENPPGILRDIQEYYNLTAIKSQPLFGVATGLILGSVVLGRRYDTGALNNYTSLYFLLVAKSGTGKDHPKSVVRKLLEKCNLSWMEKAGGYTAANTVMKSLQRQPLQVSFFEEIGQKLNEASGNSRSMATGVFRQMLDIWSSCHSMTVGDEYSDGTVPTVKKPAMTVVGITTPRELFRAINESLIEQGFVNRLLPFISMEERKVSKLSLDGCSGDVQALEDKICAWIKSHWSMFTGDLGSLLEPDKDFLANPDPDGGKEIPFNQAAIDYLNLAEEDIVMLADSLEKSGLDDMLSRCRETTMRVALISALMTDSIHIELEHVQWSYSLVLGLMEVFIEEIKRSVSGSDFEAMKLEALQALRLAGEKGIKPALMPKVAPFSKWTKKERDEVLADLLDSDLADRVKVRTGKRGPGSMVWVALK